MANVFFCSDLHFGHKGIERFRPFVEDSADNEVKIIDDWVDAVTKRDIVYVLGDAAFTTEACDLFGALPGTKYLVRGNHDELDTTYYLKYFKQVYGLLKYKEFWLSHAPIHPDELRGRINLHGHVHYSSVRLPFNPAKDVRQMLDHRYFNCCVENLRDYGSSLISLDTVRSVTNVKTKYGNQPEPMENYAKE